MKNLYHISDIHIRNHDRHNEYQEVFNNLYNTIKRTENNIIVFTGDLFHEKCQMSPEAIILFKELMINISDLGIIIIMDGNHDVNINNNKRKSAIYASIKNLKTVNDIHYLTNTNLEIQIDNIHFILTPMDNQVSAIENKNTNDIYVALYHGTLYKSKLDNNYEIDDKTKLKTSDFNDYDIVMLGDIHKHQFMNSKKSIGYASSLIQQNFGESVDNHGIIKWDIETKTGQFIEIQNDICYIKFNLTTDGFIPDCTENILKLKKKINVEINYDDYLRNDIEKYMDLLKKDYDIISYRFNENKKEKDKFTNVIEDKTIVDIYKELMKNNGKDIDNDIVSKLEEYSNVNMNNKEIKLIKMEFENLFSYGKKNNIEFEHMNGIISIVGNNGAGKSSIIDAILFALYDKYSKGKSKDALNIQKNSGYCHLWFSINNEMYKVERKITATSSTVYLFKGEENISNTKKKDTDNDIIKLVGDYDLLSSICISLQEGINLANMNDFDKMKIFYNLLNIEKYDEIRKKSETTKCSISRLMSNLKREITDITSKIPNEKEILENIADNEEQQIKLEKEVKKLSKNETKLEIEIKELKHCKKMNLEIIQKELNKKLKLNTNTEEINNEIEELYDEINSFDFKDSNFEDDITKNKNELTKLNKQLIELVKSNINYDSQDESDEEDEIIDIELVNKNMEKLNNDKLEITEKLNKLNNNVNIKQVYELLTSCKYSSKCTKCDKNKEIISNIEYNENEEEINKNKKDLEKQLNKINKSLMENETNVIKYNEFIKMQDKKQKLKMKKDKLKLEQEQMKKDFEKNKEENIKKLNNEIDIIKTTIKTFENSIVIRNKINTLTTSIDNKKKLLEEITTVKTDIEELKNKIKDIEQYNDLNEKLSKIIEQKEKKETELNKIKLFCNNLNKKLGEIEMSNKILKDKLKQQDEYMKEYNDTIKIIDLYEKYKMMEYILTKYIKKLEVIMNNILMTIVSYHIEIEQDGSELKLYKVENNIKINTRQLSGNEKFIINIAMKCAFNKMGVSYKSDFIIIDEGFGSCDNEKIEKIPDMFEVIKREFKMCLIISHVDKIKNMNNKMIEVVKNKGVSKIIY